MYDELIKRLREPCQYENCILCQQAADAIEELSKKIDEWREEACKWNSEYYNLLDNMPCWIPVTEDTPSDFVSVQAHIVGAEPFPTVREAYVIGGKWFFPALKEFLPVDVWKWFDEPPKEET